MAHRVLCDYSATRTWDLISLFVVQHSHRPPLPNAPLFRVLWVEGIIPSLHRAHEFSPPECP
jgi:hypothetical protein